MKNICCLLFVGDTLRRIRFRPLRKSGFQALQRLGKQFASINRSIIVGTTAQARLVDPDETSDRRRARDLAIEALIAAGASKFSTLLLGYWPQVRPAFWSIAIFRGDISVRESAVLGLGGAGGIGIALDTALNLLYWTKSPSFCLLSLSS